MVRAARADEALLLTPGSTEEAASTIGTLSAKREHLSVAGGGTGASWLPLPEGAPARLSTLGLDRIVAYDPADLTVTVEAGCRLADVAARLAAHGQWLPCAYPAHGTIGGLVATAAWGRTSPGGAIRDRILGLTAVTATGEITRTGSRVVKSVAGYDLAKVYCGSFGTLALVAEVTFKVAPLPAKRDAIFFGGDLASCLGFSSDLLRSPFRPAAVFVLNSRAAGALVRGQPKASHLVVIQLAGRQGVVQRLARECAALADQFGLSLVETGTPPAEVDSLVDHLEAGADVVIDQPPVLLRATMTSTQEEETTAIADAASGRLVLGPGTSQATTDDIWPVVSPAGGSLRRRIDGGADWRRSLHPGARDLARRLKETLDPNGIFNRGLLEQLI